jgi:hypothetical protein
MSSMVTDRFFADIQTQRRITIGPGKSVALPIRYFDLVMFGGRFSADITAVRQALPSARLAPVELAPGRAEVILAAYDYRQCDLGPYREFGAWIPVVDQDDSANQRPGLYCHFLPLTSEEGRIGGVAEWGFPKFLADIAIAETPSHLHCRVSVDDREIVSLEVEPAALVPTPQPAEFAIYTVKGDEIVRSRVRSAWRDGVRAGVGGARVQLGDHPRADALRRLDLAPDAIDHRYEPGRMLLLYGPEDRFAR